MSHLFTGETRCIRRRNQDGTVDSICSRCGLMIGRASYPVALELLEERHVCQPLERRKKVRIAHRIYDPIKRKQINGIRPKKTSRPVPQVRALVLGANLG